MLTRILKIKGDWQEVVDDSRFTVGKEPLGRRPSNKFKRAILVSEHSTIRSISVKWVWENMKHWVTVHWVRHKWEKFVRTQRTDRTGINRDELRQDEPQSFTGEANTQHLIDTWRKRLCYMASRETREYAEDFKMELHNVEPEIADVLVPNCVYRCGCPEMHGCGWFAMHQELHSPVIQERYDTYNRVFREERKNILDNTKHRVV